MPPSKDERASLEGPDKMESNHVTTSTQAVDFGELARLIVEAAKSDAAPAPSTPPECQNASQPDVALASTRRLEELPKELGVLLASVGIMGIILPGIAGTPALIAGGLVLWPKTFSGVESWFSHRFPIAHRKSMQQVGRFLDDLDRRYPQFKNPTP
jgi:hypothetical protein